MINNKRKIFTESEITQIVKDGMTHFSEIMCFSVSLNNTKLAFFTPQNGKGVYESFCKEYLEKWDKYSQKDENYFESFIAQAFVGDKYYGIMIRTDLSLAPSEFYKIIMHEIAHIFCVTNELGGDIFYDKYCPGDGMEIGFISAGYAIWREAAANIMSDSILSPSAKFSLQEVKQYIMAEYKKTSHGNAESKEIVSDILSTLFNTKELGASNSWDEAEKELKRIIKFSSDAMYLIVELVYEKLNDSPFWKITRYFIEDLGHAYITLIADIELANFGKLLV